MRTPEGWHKAWLKIRHCFKMPRTPKTRAHPGSELLFAPGFASRFARLLRRGWSLRYGPRHYMSAYAASLRSVAPGSIYFFLRYPGFRGYAAPPPGYYMAPCGAPNSARLRSQKFPHHRPFNFRFIGQFEIN